MRWDKREKIISRDGNKCTGCGLTNNQHKKRYRVNLFVHHIDGYGAGFSSKKKNNDPGNLTTLCIKCHNFVHKNIPSKIVRKRKLNIRPVLERPRNIPMMSVEIVI